MNSSNDKYRLYEWQYQKDDLKYCPRCGTKFILQDLHIENQPQLVCDHCRFIFYLDPKVVVAAVVVNDGRILLLKRAEEPGKGKWGLPGGHVERGWSVTTAIELEILEEAGVRFNNKGLLLVIDLPNQQGIQLTFFGDGDDQDLSNNLESHEARYIALNEISFDDLAFDSTRLAIQKYKESLKSPT